MPQLRPLRDYDEKDVLNLYTFSGQPWGVTGIVNKGTLVGLLPGGGWRNDQDPTNIIGSYGDFSVNNVQALRYGNTAAVTFYGTGVATGGYINESPLGLTLFDIRELDENTIPLKYNPRKAAELEACISGQAVPIVIRGTFLYSGLTGSFGAGAALYGSTSGTITAYNNVAANLTRVGTALGGTGVDGSALIRFSLSSI